MNTLGASINRIRKATGAALGRASAVSGKGKSGQDVDLKLYGSLTPTQFDVIGRVYGEENLLRYIQTMEARRLKNGNT